MIFDVTTTDAEYARSIAEGSAFHLPDSHSPWMIPVFLAAIVPVLWWRRSVLVVSGSRPRRSWCCTTCCSGG